MEERGGRASFPIMHSHLGEGACRWALKTSERVDGTKLTSMHCCCAHCICAGLAHLERSLWHQNPGPSKAVETTVNQRLNYFFFFLSKADLICFYLWVFDVWGGCVKIIKLLFSDSQWCVHVHGKSLSDVQTLNCGKRESCATGNFRPNAVNQRDSVWVLQDFPNPNPTSSRDWVLCLAKSPRVHLWILP